MKKPSLKWLHMKEVYLCFKQKDCILDYSDQAALEMFLHESHGEAVSSKNGFYWCKRNMDITLAMWEEDIKKGELIKAELYNDIFPHSWLDAVLYPICIPREQLLEVVLESKAIPAYGHQY